MRRSVLVVFAAALAASASARSLVDRLPSDSALIGSFDLEAARKSAIVGPRMMAAPIPEQVSGLEGSLRKAGIDLRKDIAQVAFGVVPGKGGAEDDVALIASGAFDPAKVKEAALSSGAVAAKLGSVSALRLPKQGDTDGPAFLSFLDGLAVIGGEAATKAVHARTAQASEVSRMPSDIPKDATFWVAGDLGQIHPPDATGQALSQIQRIQLWGRLTDAVELHAVADAADAQIAQQVAGLAGLASGFVGGANPALGSALGGLSVAAKDKRITASLTLTKAQLDALEAQAAKTAAEDAAASDGSAPAKPAEAQAAPAKPADSKPAASKPASTKPASTKPAPKPASNPPR